MHFKNIDPELISLVKKLQNESFETYIVGGAVRDLLLGIKPKDYDISTAASPEQIKAVFKRKARIIGHRFKLVHYYAQNRKIIEISTFRREPLEHEKMIEIKGKLRPNDNCYGTSREDAWRRDFTINAIFYDPISETILDFTGMGRNDLENKIIRIIGEPYKRFIEDPVRILRALKLLALYDFTIEENTLSTLLRMIPLIKNASHSRLTLELEKIIKNQNTGKILKTFHEYGFLKFFLPQLDKELNASPEKAKILFDILEQRKLRISQGKYRLSMSIALAAIAAPFLEEIFDLADENVFFPDRSIIQDKLLSTIRKLIYPHNFAKKLVYISADILLLQPYLFKSKPNSRMSRHPHFHHACELFEILKSCAKD